MSFTTAGEASAKSLSGLSDCDAGSVAGSPAGSSFGGWICCPELAYGAKRCDDGGTVFGPEQAAPDDWARKAGDHQAALTRDRLTSLAGQLHVSPKALRRIGAGWNKHSHAYTFPERAGNGRIIGIATRRPTDGAKKTMKGSKRGLVVPRDLDRKQPLLIVEGPTDTAAALTPGLQAVGRPSAMGGVTHLADMLADWPGELIILGERDQKDGRWPGRDGARQVAGALARRLGRPIAWALPPEGVKDLRDWLKREVPDLANAEACKAAGERMLAALRNGAETVTDTDAAPGEGELQERRPSQATVLVQLADRAVQELFHDGDTTYATIPVADHLETWPVKSKGFRRWLSREFFRERGKTPASQAMQDALAVLEGRALFDGAERKVFVRVGHANGSLYLDLGGREWHCIEVAGDGWRVIAAADAPVRFRRTRGMLALPMPEQGGTLNELRRFVNVGGDADFVLVCASQIGALHPKGPYPLLAVHGEQGSAKSFTCRALRRLIDPNEAELRSEPRDERDLVIAGNNGWVIALDNLSRVPRWLSDALCRIATGGGFATRELYTDADEMIFSSQRPIVINGIEELATRSDLLDRAIVVTLPPIAEADRRDEAALWRDFEAVRPRLLGALLTAVSAAVRSRDSVRLDRLPRMADFAQWVVAAEQGGGVPWRAGDFMDAYASNRAGAHEHVLEASVVAPVLRSWLRAISGSWTGTASSLLERLTEHAGDRVSGRKGWPARANVLSSILRRLAPDLRAVGVAIGFDQRDPRTKNRVIELRVAGGAGPPRGGNTRATGAPPKNPVLDAEDCVGGAGGAGGADSPTFSCHESPKARLADAGSETATLTQVGMEEFEL